MLVHFMEGGKGNGASGFLFLLASEGVRIWRLGRAGLLHYSSTIPTQFCFMD